MQQYSFFLFFIVFSTHCFTQINYDLSNLNELEASAPEDFRPLNRIGFILETNDGFIYANHKIRTETPPALGIKRTDNNLVIIDSIIVEDIPILSEGTIAWGGDFNQATGITTLFGLNKGYFSHPPTFYWILIDENFEVIETKFYEYPEKIIDIRKPIKNGEDGYYFLFNVEFSDGTEKVRIGQVNNGFEIVQEKDLNYSWSFTEGLTLSQDGNLHIALSTNTVTIDNEFNQIAANEIEGLAQYEYTCRYQRKTVNLSGDHQYFGGLCQELYQDSLSPWITLGEFRRERIFKYNSATQSFQSFFNHVPFGYDFDYFDFVQYEAFDAINPNCLYLGSNFYKSISVSEQESVFSINSVDSIGNLRWLKLFGIIGFYSLDKVIALQDEGVLLVIQGWVQDEATEIWNLNVYYMKIDKDGNIVGTTDIPNLIVYDSYIKTFPNPATDYFQIENAMAWKKGTYVNVINAMGQIMMKYEIREEWEKPAVDISDWQSGVYYLQFYNEKGLVDVKKVVVD